MSESKDGKIILNASDVINALLHQRQSQQHLATQESVENLQRETEANINNLRSETRANIDALRSETKANFVTVDKRFEQVDKRFEQVDKRFDTLESKFDRLQWFIVGAALAIIFKDNIFHLLNSVHL